ncbi:hypothetical protein GDO81_025786 [Engystomops pustulosus]|uniref:Uncharacterized protein n=1 Tax=Engystomops pustulosus TaxID=76066 RepID=A0AAV6Z031_ENGPU|nr:hypothetical protein GDO81_025786 [Engystomops pustulosus]
MASADLREELDCSICLTTYTDPVMLRCGHNFCRVCIDRVLDTQDGSGGYSCPDCRENFQDRPELRRNIALHNVAERLKSTEPHQEEVTGICCTYCVDSSVPVVKSCLNCEVFLCNNHLRVHSEGPEHILIEISTFLEHYKCSVHGEWLKYYCTMDATCICMSCHMFGEHRGHQAELLNMVFERKKTKLINVLPKLKNRIKKTEERIQRLEEQWRKAQEKASEESARVSALLKDSKGGLDGLRLRMKLLDLEKNIHSEIDRQEMEVSLSVSALIQKLETQKDELSRKMRHIEELCNMTDPLTVLQEPDTGDLCDPEEGGAQEKASGEAERVTALFIDIRRRLDDLEKRVLSDISRQEKEKSLSLSALIQKLEIQKDELSRKMKDIEELCNMTDPLTVLQEPDTDRGIYGEGPTNILLDVKTAANDLLISDDVQTITWTVMHQGHPETSERFQSRQVLSCRRFTSGRHYWDVEGSRTGEWMVGMCYPSMDRTGDGSYLGENDKSWGLSRRLWYDNPYSAIHDRKEIPLPNVISSDRFRICLDYEAGKLSFYELCDPIRHLHTFTTTFTEPLHAVLYVYGSSVKILGGK